MTPSKSTPRQAHHNLPYPLTRFIGRNVELVELKRLLRERRLVTLTGTGGSGKTRLALEAALALAQDFPDGAYLVDLAPLSRPELLAETVARVLGVASPPDQPLLDALAGFLCARGSLLVLDNCEHLLDECARFASTLLAMCPDVRVLATSREPLGVGGECTFRVPLLSFPDPLDLPGPEEVAGFEAVQLFVDRALLADPTFDLTADNVPAVAQVCARLDGIPLALELAAAALRAVPISQLAARLDQRFRLLASGDRTVLPRHQTLRALLDWSYILLSPAEQAVFRRLAVFPAEWTLDAAEAVCGKGIAHAEVLGIFVGLVNKSVVQIDPVTGRYRMLETVRLYALEKLSEAGEQATAARRHFEWYLQFAEEGARQIGGPAQQQWSLLLEGEQANLRAALRWAIESGSAEEAALLALALRKFWLARAYNREARRWLEQVLGMEAGAPLAAPKRARLLSALGVLADTMNEFEQAGSYHNEALRIWRDQGDDAGIAGALHDLGWHHFQSMDLGRACQYAEESLAVARRAGDSAVVAGALNLFALSSVEAGWWENLAPMLEESLTIWRLLGMLPETVTALATLARVEQRSGDIGRAVSHMLEALRLQVGLGDYAGLISCLVLMLYLAVDAGRPQQASAGGGFQQFAYLDGGKPPHRPAAAARVIGAMDAWEDKVIGRHSVQWETLVVPLCHRLSADMGEAGFAREVAAGRALDFTEIVSLAEDIARSAAALAPRLAARPSAVPAAAAGAPSTSVSPAAPANGQDAAGLTRREVEVLRLIAAGLTNAQAAERLTVTPRTINAHLTSIYGKTGVTGRAGAIRFAVDHHFI